MSEWWDNFRKVSVGILSGVQILFGQCLDGRSLCGGSCPKWSLFPDFCPDMDFLEKLVWKGFASLSKSQDLTKNGKTNIENWSF